MAAVLSNSPVGVDLEPISREVRDTVVQRVFKPNERELGGCKYIIACACSYPEKALLRMQAKKYGRFHVLHKFVIQVCYI